MSKKQSLSSIQFMSVVILFWFAQYVYIPYQTTFLSLQSVSQNLIGTVIGAYGLSQLLLRIPVGFIADKGVNHKYIISSGILLAGIASLIRIYKPTGIGFLTANIISGIASSTWISFMVYYLNQFKKEDQLKATSQLIMANNFGMLLGFTTSSLLFNSLGMSFICFLSFLSGSIGFIISLSIPSKNTKNKMKITFKDTLLLVKNKNLLIYGSLALVQQGIQMSTTMSFTTQIIQSLGASNLLIGFSTIFYMACAVLFAKLGTTSYIKQINKHLIILIPAIIFLQIIPGISTGILFSLVTSLAIQTVPTHLKSSGMGIFQAIYAIGMTLFPILTGFIHSHFSIQLAFLSLSTIAILTASLYHMMIKKEGKII
jgi:MFS family permease